MINQTISTTNKKFSSFQSMFALQQIEFSLCAVFSGRGSLFKVSQARLQTQNTHGGRDEVMSPHEADDVMVASVGAEAGDISDLRGNIDTRGQVRVPRQ